MRYAAWNRRGYPGAFRLSSWRIALIVALALAIGVAIAVVATGILLIALPIIVAGVLVYRLFGVPKRRRPSGTVIEGEYEVLEGARATRRRPERR